jgi:hypothetical protein
MSISAIGSSSYQAYQSAPSASGFAKARQSFEDLGSPLSSGNLTDAKAALAELQKNAPPGASQQNNPLSAKIEALGKAVDSGDLKAAQQAYTDIQKTIAQGPGRGGRPPGGAPPAGARPPSGDSAAGSKESSGSSSSSSSSKTYDKKDTNKDGKVSVLEELSYASTHPDLNAAQDASTKTSGGLNLTA